MKSSHPLVSIIIVNYNGKHFLKGCLDSLLAMDYPKKQLETILVDNGSTDGSLEFLRENYPNVKVLKNDINNYCRANNLGIKVAKGKYIAFLNNDTQVDKNWLKELVKIINQDEKIGAVTGKVLFPDGKLQGTGHVELPNFYWSDRGFQEEDTGLYDKLAEMKSLSHCAVIYRKTCLRAIGPLDEDFNMFVEDVDMAIRATQRGWKLMYAPEGCVSHKFHGTATNDRADFFCERNRLLLVAKHYPEKLPGALLGSGYFTALNNRADLFEILPKILDKLITLHPQDIVRAIWPVFFEELGKILNVEKKHLTVQLESRNRSLSEKEQLVQQKDEQLSELNVRLVEMEKKLSEQDQQAARKGEQLVVRDRQLSELHARLIEMEKKILEEGQQAARKDEKLIARDRQLSELHARLIEMEKKISEEGQQAARKDEQLIARDRQLSELNVRLVEMEKKLSEQDQQGIRKDEQLIARDRQFSELNVRLVEMGKKLSEQDQRVIRKDEQLIARDRQFSELNVRLVEMEKKLSEQDQRVIRKDEQMIKMDKEIQAQKGVIRELESVISAKDAKINLSAEETAQLKMRLSEQGEKISLIKEEAKLKGEHLSMIDEMLRKKADELNEVYDSEAYRLIVRPFIWPFFSFLKLILITVKGMMGGVRKLFGTRPRKKTVSIAQFYAMSGQAQAAKGNEYFVRLVNRDFSEREAHMIIDIWPFRHRKHPDRHWGYFSFKVCVGPRRACVVKIVYDWDKEAVVCVGDKEIKTIDLWRGSMNASELYIVYASLRDERSRPVEGLHIIQKKV